MDNLQEQITELTKAHEEGIDTVASGVQDLYRIIDHLSSQLRAADVLLASLKFLLIKKNIIDEKDLEAMHAHIVKMTNKQLEDFKPNKEVPTATNMEDELKIIHDAAKKAAENPYDADAFIFGN